MAEGWVMVSACVLICCESGKYSEVAKKVREIKGVVRAFSASGRWDVVAEVEAADMKALTDISLKINGLPGVKATETLVEAAF
jgi:DNA-binding Lrp family transcriptional regulator